MPAARSLDLVGPDLEAYMQESFNRLILTILRRLATKKRSPVYTGFFASSWKADTSPIKANDELEEPWLGLSKAKWNDKANKDYKIDPRFYPPNKAFNYKRRVYIGNTAKYAVYALESGKVQQFVQGPEMAKLFGEAFKPRAPRISVGARQGIGTFGTQAGEIYTGYTEL
jgi:hypothetical protein|tara:strand:- start:3714 stop:4223 length:510 start_codon:yes stop_codon:yes gene_type:complete